MVLLPGDDEAIVSCTKGHLSSSGGGGGGGDELLVSSGNTWGVP